MNLRLGASLVCALVAGRILAADAERVPLPGQPEGEAAALRLVPGAASEGGTRDTYRIELWRRGRRVQVLGTEHHLLGADLKWRDVNFDGRPDLSATHAVAGKWHQETFWSYDPASHRFVRDPLARALSALTFTEMIVDPEHRRIETLNFHGQCYPERRVYTASRHGLRLIEEHRLDPGTGDCVPVAAVSRPSPR